MQRLIICAPHLILSLWLYQRGCEGWICGRYEIVTKQIKFRSASHKEYGHMGDLGIHVRIIKISSCEDSL